MPYANVNSINIYYEVHGEGAPLIFIEGLGTASWIWFKQLPVLKDYFKVVIFDNRGAGKTDKPDTEYSIEMFANDLIGLMDFLGIEKASLFGVSMGGFIAIKTSILYPERVQKLILCSTGYGGPDIIPEDQEVIQYMTCGNCTENKDYKISKSIELNFSKSYIESNQEEIEKIMKWREENKQPEYAYKRQLDAIIDFDEADRVEKIKVPTLILAGKNDKIISCRNAELLNNKIKNSRLKIYEDASHLVNIEKADEVNKDVILFLKDYI